MVQNVLIGPNWTRFFFYLFFCGFYLSHALLSERWIHQCWVPASLVAAWTCIIEIVLGFPMPQQINDFGSRHCRRKIMGLVRLQVSKAKAKAKAKLPSVSFEPEHTIAGQSCHANDNTLQTSMPRCTQRESLKRHC